MREITQKTVQELDLLYGLYELAIEYAKRIKPDEPVEMEKWIETRQRILGRTGASSQAAIALLKEFDAAPLVPAGERALVEEKRRMIQDLSFKMSEVDGRILKKMQEKMSQLRTELARGTRQKNAAKAYLKTSVTQSMFAAPVR